MHMGSVSNGVEDFVQAAREKHVMSWHILFYLFSFSIFPCFRICILPHIRQDLHSPCSPIPSYWGSVLIRHPVFGNHIVTVSTVLVISIVSVIGTYVSFFFLLGPDQRLATALPIYR